MIDLPARVGQATSVGLRIEILGKISCTMNHTPGDEQRGKQRTKETMACPCEDMLSSCRFHNFLSELVGY